MHHAVQRRRGRNQLERDTPISCHDLAGDAVEITIQVECELALRRHARSDFLRHIQAEAAGGKRRQDGPCKHRPIILMNEHPIRFAGAQRFQDMQRRSHRLIATVERRMRVTAAGIGEYVLAALPGKRGQHRTSAGDPDSARSHTVRVLRAEVDARHSLQHGNVPIGGHRHAIHA